MLKPDRKANSYIFPGAETLRNIKKCLQDIFEDVIKEVQQNAAGWDEPIVSPHIRDIIWTKTRETAEAKGYQNIAEILCDLVENLFLLKQEIPLEKIQEHSSLNAYFWIIENSEFGWNKEELVNILWDAALDMKELTDVMEPQAFKLLSIHCYDIGETVNA